jgi:hypothetical protein
MDYVDLPQVVNEVVMVEGSVWVEDKVHHFFLWFVVPLGRLVDKASTVDEDQASHLKQYNQALTYVIYPWKFLKFGEKVHVGEHRDAIILHLIWLKQSL